MFFREYFPHPELKNHIRCYWTLEISGSASQYEWLHFLVENVEFTFNLSDRAKFIASDIKTRMFPQCCVYGPMTRTMHLKPVSEVKMFGVCFRPGGAYYFFPCQISELVNRCVIIDDLLRGNQSEIIHRVRYDCKTTVERIDLLDQYFLRHLDKKRKDNSIAAAVNIIEAYKGQVNIEYVAKSIGLSPRQLERKFKERVGISPKQLCRSLRFKNMLKHINVSSNVSWATTAVSCGYYDQSHMIREFKYYTGESPLAYLVTPKAMDGYFA